MKRDFGTWLLVVGPIWIQTGFVAFTHPNNIIAGITGLLAGLISSAVFYNTHD